MVNFCAVLPVHDCTHTRMATTLRPKFKALLVFPHFWAKIAPKASRSLVETNLKWPKFFHFPWFKFTFFLRALVCITALTALVRSAACFNGGLCRYKSINGVLLNFAALVSDWEKNWNFVWFWEGPDHLLISRIGIKTLSRIMQLKLKSPWS